MSINGAFFNINGATSNPYAERIKEKSDGDVFITKKNKDILRERLISRQTDDLQTIEFRLIQAHNEMQHIHNFDYLIINDDITTAKEAMVAIARSLKYQQIERLSKIIQKW